MVGGAGGEGAGSLIEAVVLYFARSPVLRSFLLLVGCVAILFFFSAHGGGRGVPGWAY
jgi:membrane-bound ClpP family serine protease